MQWWLKACLPARREQQEEKKERILKLLDEVRASRSSSSPMWGARAPASSVSMREELADGTALVQEYIESEEGAIVHVEVLDGRYLYAIRIVRDRDANFNLCRRTSARRARSIGTSGGRGSRRLPAGRQAGARRPRLQGPRQGD